MHLTRDAAGAHPIEDVTLSNIRLGFDGGGTRAEASRSVPEREKNYPESTMFGTLPAYGFYCRHARGLRFEHVELRTSAPDLRHAMVFDDVRDVVLHGLDAQSSPGAAAMVRMTGVRGAVVRGCAPQSPVETLLEIQGKATEQIVLEENDYTNVREVAAVSEEVPAGALSRK